MGTPTLAGEDASAAPQENGSMLGVFEYLLQMYFPLGFPFVRRDIVEWDEEQENKAFQAVLKNSGAKLSEEEGPKFQNDANVYWDSF